MLAEVSTSCLAFIMGVLFNMESVSVCVVIY